MQIDRTTPPTPLDPVPFNIPHAFRTTLPNGLRVVIFDDERLPLVAYRLAFMSGDSNDPADQIGLNTAMAAMVTEGTENYTSRELAEKIERLGGSLHASSTDDFTLVSASGLTMYSPDLLQLMSEVLFAPTFPENELDLYKRNTIENLKFSRSQPGFLASEQVGRLLYGKHPYAVTSPKPSDIESLDRDMLSAARARTFLPNNAVFIAVGDVRKDELLVEIEDHFGDWSPGDRHAHSFPSIPSRSERSLTIVDRPGSAQANIVLANVAVPRNHPDYFSLMVMNQVLGAGASSRVFMNLREEKGYTYGAYTRLDMRKLGGHFEATAEVRTAVTGESLKEFFFELGRIRDERVSDGELADAKNFLTGVFPIRAETLEGLTGLIVNQELFGLPDDYLQTYRERIDAVTADDVQRVANAYIQPDKLAIVIVGSGHEILEQAGEFADSIETYDKNGHKMEFSDHGSLAEGVPTDVAGEWELSLEFMGQQVPVTLKIDQQGSSLQGTISTMLGEGRLTGGKITGSAISATASTDFQGQAVEFVIDGAVKGDIIDGSITSQMIPGPLSFTGRKQA